MSLASDSYPVVAFKYLTQCDAEQQHVCAHMGTRSPT